MSWFSPKPPKSLVVVKPNFLAPDVIARFLDYARSTESWNKLESGTRWDGRVVHSPLMPKDLEQQTITVLLAIREALRAEFPSDQELYPDGLCLVRWLPGDFQEPHADAENPDNTQHPFFWRKYASLIYLNNNFEGGDLYFPNKKLRVKPRPGTLTLFPGTMEYLHEVETITNGTRYTLAAFWTNDRSQSIYPEAFAPDQVGAAE